LIGLCLGNPPGCSAAAGTPDPRPGSWGPHLPLKEAHPPGRAPGALTSPSRRLIRQVGLLGTSPTPPGDSSAR